MQQRAKMFMDLAFVEGESVQVAGFRAGAKMRAKKDGGDYPVYGPKGSASGSTSSVVVYQSGMGVGLCRGPQRSGNKVRMAFPALFLGSVPLQLFRMEKMILVLLWRGMQRCAGDALKPVLLGEGGPPVWRHEDGQSFDTPAVWSVLRKT